LGPKVWGVTLWGHAHYFMVIFANSKYNSNCIVQKINKLKKCLVDRIDAYERLSNKDCYDELLLDKLMDDVIVAEECF